MPITIPDNLPSRWMLESEGVFVMDHGSAEAQGLRPLRLALVQPQHDPRSTSRLAALIANSPLHVDLSLVVLGPAPAQGMPAGTVFGLDAITRKAYDGIIVSHAPVDHLDWHAVPCWDEFRDFLDWSEERIRARLFIGWSAQAALQHVYGLDRRVLDRPIRGLHPCRAVRRNSFLMRGFDEEFDVDLDCAAIIDEDDVLQSPGLRILAACDRSGAYLVRNANRRDVFVLGQPDGPFTVASPGLPQKPDGDDRGAGAAQVPIGGSQSHASLLILNWLNFYVYQPLSNQLDATVPDRR